MLRIFIRRVIDLGGVTEDLDQAINILRIVSFATMGLDRLFRTRFSIAHPCNEPMDKFFKALAEMENDPDFLANPVPLQTDRTFPDGGFCST